MYPMNHIGTMNHSLLGCSGIIVQIMTAIKAGQVSKKLLNVALAIMTYLWAMNRDLLSKILLLLPNRLIALRANLYLCHT